MYPREKISHSSTPKDLQMETNCMQLLALVSAAESGQNKSHCLDLIGKCLTVLDHCSDYNIYSMLYVWQHF